MDEMYIFRARGTGLSVGNGLICGLAKPDGKFVKFVDGAELNNMLISGAKVANIDVAISGGLFCILDIKVVKERNEVFFICSAKCAQCIISVNARTKKVSFRKFTQGANGWEYRLDDVADARYSKDSFYFCVEQNEVSMPVHIENEKECLYTLKDLVVKSFDYDMKLRGYGL